MVLLFIPIAKNNVRLAVALSELVGAGLRAGTFFQFGPAGTPGPTGFLRAPAAKRSIILATAIGRFWTDDRSVNCPSDALRPANGFLFSIDH